jgi:hypothetical protein
MDDDILRNTLLTTFDYSYRHDDWVNPLVEALDGVDVEQALWKPRPELKCIWEIVLHMAVWTENMVQRIQGPRDARPSEGAWPGLPANPDAGAWSEATYRLWRALDTLRGAIQTAPFSLLQERPWPEGTVLDDLVCRFIHNAYHIGQITKLRECMPTGQ